MARSMRGARSETKRKSAVHYPLLRDFIDQIRSIQLLDPPTQCFTCLIVAPGEIEVCEVAHAEYFFLHQLTLT